MQRAKGTMQDLPNHAGNSGFYSEECVKPLQNSKLGSDMIEICCRFSQNPEPLRVSPDPKALTGTASGRLLQPCTIPSTRVGALGTDASAFDRYGN